MCGIAGIHHKHDVPASVLDQAAQHFRDSLRHRGPDGYGEHRSARAVYVNLRLAIVDRSGGDQPIYAPDAAPWSAQGIVYNGEVYNWQALRQPLEGRYAFSTHSDTEAVLATVLDQGDGGLARLNGMFGLCIWNEHEHSFLLARDRFGAKPLYVYEDEHCLAFASELRTLLGLPGLDHTLDPVGFQDYLSFRHGLAPHTQFARIRKLPAGSVLRFADGQSEVHAYAGIDLQEPATARPDADYIDELDHLLNQAVRSQLMGEVPIGVLLSGGLDSSAIAACVHQAGARLRAYSIGFPEVNEFEFSRDVARHFELDYHEVVLTQDDLRAGMDRVLGELDEPIADPACFALSRLCQDIRKDVTVVLSGEGGDEMFAGYGHHQLALQPGMDRNTLYAHFLHHSAVNLDANQWLRDKQMPLQHLRHRHFYDHADTVLNGMQSFELHTWMPENLMMKADKVLMAHSLEGRFPFLDLDLYRFASTLPQHMKLPHAGSSKHVLRQLMTPRLPASVTQRRKMGFTVPPSFFMPALRTRLQAAISDLRHTPVAEVLDLDAITRLLVASYDPVQGQAVPPFKAWSLAVLLLWWADIYPGLRKAAQPAAAPVGARQRLVVYTALIGAKEALANPLAHLPPGANTDLDLDFVCITDNADLRSPVWRFMSIGARHLPPERLSRRPKALPHEYFPDAEFSLYVDNTVSFKRLPQASDLHTEGPLLFRAFQHGTRHNPGEEATAVAMLGYDDTEVICRQLDFYAALRPLPSITPLTTATVLLRQHHAPAVRRFGVLWWESILAFSKRDQLSFDFARIEAECPLEYWPGATHDNPLLDWNGSLSPQRVRASFDNKRYAWLHRSEPDAQQDPRAHFLRQGGGMGSSYDRATDLLEYVCHMVGSSLGDQVSPRRGAARALESLLAPHRSAGQRYLLARVQGGTGAQAFDATELEHAGQALAMLLNPAQGTLIDLQAAELQADGKVYSTAQVAYDLIVLIGADGPQLGAAVQKLHRLLRRDQGSFVAVLTSPVALSQAAEAERTLAMAAGDTTLRVDSSLHASRHDNQHAPLPNTVVGYAWQTVTATVPQPLNHKPEHTA
jgi:asparagine synthase (glutamine-hydrolysing)